MFKTQSTEGSTLKSLVSIKALSKQVAWLLGCLWSFQLFADAQNGELEITALEDNIWLHTSFTKMPGAGYFPSNGLIVAEGKRAYLIDTAWSEEDTNKLLRWLSEQGLMLRAAVITHSHEDRSAGLEQLIELGIPTYASKATNELLKEQGRAEAKNEFNESVFELLKGGIEVFYPGPGHSQDNHVVWLPKAKILFGGCLVRFQSAEDLGNTADANIESWDQSVQAIADRYPRIGIVVPGHGAVGGKELLEHTKTLVQLKKMEGAIEFAN